MHENKNWKIRIDFHSLFVEYNFFEFLIWFWLVLILVIKNANLLTNWSAQPAVIKLYLWWLGDARLISVIKNMLIIHNQLEC
jgi:hypothetical protein